MAMHYSLIELSARALMLEEHALVDIRTRDLTREDAICVRLNELGLRDEFKNRRTVRDILNSSFQTNLNTLCAAIFTFNKGLPILKNHIAARYLMRILDPDILICLHPKFRLIDDEQYDWSAVPAYHSDSLSNLFTSASIDTHIHLGGALPPVFFWVALVGCELGPEVLNGASTGYRGHGPDSNLRQAMTKAIWLRLWLARQAWQYLDAFNHIQSFTWDVLGLDREYPPDSKSYDNVLIRDIPWILSPDHLIQRNSQIGNTNYWPYLDPLRSEPADTNRVHYAEGERRLICGLRLILEQDKCPLFKKEIIEKYLIDYIRIRNAFHHLWLHEMGNFGLQRFAENFDRRGFIFVGNPRRKRRHRRMLYKLERCRMTAALDAQLTEAFDETLRDQLRAPERQIEIRVSPPEGRSTLHVWRAWIDGIRAHLYPAKWKRPGLPLEQQPRHNHQCGFVVHLIKLPVNSKRTQTVLSQNYLESVTRLLNLLHAYPKLRPFVIGLDAAARERDTPPRTFLDAFRHAHEFTNNHRARSGEPKIRLGYTYHVGEDCDDMLTGLRHIDEVVRLILPSDAGGRLGHALILGETPRDWYSKRGDYVDTMLHPHLLDLIWARGRLAEAGESHFSWLDQRLLEYTGFKDLEKIARCYTEMSMKGRRGKTPDSTETALINLLGDDIPNRTISFPVDASWLDLVTCLQVMLHDDIARKRICIEANPTSNLLVGGYTSYEALPYKPLIEADISLSLNTDDPGLFMTSLPGEFMAMYEALTKTHTHRQRLQWLRDRAADAQASSFLGPPMPMIGQDELFLID